MIVLRLLYLLSEIIWLIYIKTNFWLNVSCETLFYFSFDSQYLVLYFKINILYIVIFSVKHNIYKDCETNV